MTVANLLQFSVGVCTSAQPDFAIIIQRLCWLVFVTLKLFALGRTMIAIFAVVAFLLFA